MDWRQMLAFCIRLVRTESLPGGEEAAARLAAEEMRKLGYCTRIDAYGSVIGILPGSGGPTVCFDAHLDTVPVTDRDQWTVDPFGGECREGKIFGRGACDMKGQAAAMVYGVARAGRAVSRRGDLMVTLTVCEEVMEGVALQAVLRQHPAQVVVVGEATGLRLARGGRGRAELTVTTRGRAAHSSHPEEGENAVMLMARVLQGLANASPPRHPVLGEGIAVVTDVISEPYPGMSVVPHGCRITIDRRLLPTDTQQKVLEELQEVALSAVGSGKAEVRIARGRHRTWTGAELEGAKYFPAWLLPEEHPVVQRARQALRQCGLPGELTTYQYCTNAAGSCGVLGIPTVGFGPGEERGAHVADEHMSVDQLVEAMAGYEALARELASGS